MDQPIRSSNPIDKCSKRFVAVSRFSLAASQLSDAVSLPIAGPLAAWMPPSSPHGRVHGVSRER
ncbi:hypothetical protein XmelCFBP4644_08370 [Xanthomonas melonis]|uniref:Uncharacterized protein n=1 Tax=Xanthomonas melonis TaxID=56456 RepID=A0A2S7DIE2_9XANT|nr:hypothetical protein XmelCFBP4644_08370 [Xanthomonas melonis]